MPMNKRWAKNPLLKKKNNSSLQIRLQDVHEGSPRASERPGDENEN